MYVSCYIFIPKYDSGSPDRIIKRKKNINWSRDSKWNDQSEVSRFGIFWQPGSKTVENELYIAMQ